MTSMLTRRDFLKLSALGAGTVALYPWNRFPLSWPARASVSAFPEGEHLGRVTVAGLPLMSRPTPDSLTIRLLYEDEIIVVLRRVVGQQPWRISQTWIETPEGYVWSPAVQPVWNRPNEPVQTLPETSLGSGMWAEVSIPYVELVLDNPPARAPWLNYRISTLGLPPRFFYSQIVWVDQIQRDEDGQVWYRLNEKYGSGDLFWAQAEAFHPLTAEEMSPLSPEVEEKRIVVNINYQTMSCFEGNTEVYFARVSTGALYNAAGERVDAWGTPIGEHRIWRKAVSLPLSGGAHPPGGACPRWAGSVCLSGQGWLSIPRTGTTTMANPPRAGASTARPTMPNGFIVGRCPMFPTILEI